MSTTPPSDPWGDPGSGTQPPPPPGGYPPPPPAWEQPPPAAGGYGQPGGYPAPPPSWQQPQGAPYGAPSPGPGGQLAGWWQRVGATVVDGLILLIPNLVLRYAGGQVGGGFLALILDAAYITLMLSQKNGQTLGNMAVKTRVVDSRTGGQITAGKAFGRWASEFVLVILFFVPWILDVLWPLWDRQNQTLHDKMAGTVVLRDPM